MKLRTQKLVTYDKMTTKKKFKNGWGMRRRTMVQGADRLQLVLIMRFAVLQKTLRWQSKPFVKVRYLTVCSPRLSLAGQGQSRTHS